MAFLSSPIHLSDLPKDDGFDVMPAGQYNAVVKQADLMPTKSGTGEYIKLRLDVVGPTHAGRVIFTNLNIRNPNPQAENIGRQQLGVIMQAAGVAALEDTNQIIGATVGLTVAIKDDPTYGRQNEVKGFKVVGATMTSSFTSPVVALTPAAPVSAGATPPWAS